MFSRTLTTKPEKARRATATPPPRIGAAQRAARLILPLPPATERRLNDLVLASESLRLTLTESRRRDRYDQKRALVRRLERRLFGGSEDKGGFARGTRV